MPSRDIIRESREHSVQCRWLRGRFGLSRDDGPTHGPGEAAEGRARARSLESVAGGGRGERQGRRTPVMQWSAYSLLSPLTTRDAAPGKTVADSRANEDGGQTSQ